MEFFNPARRHFFRPMVSKYRGLIVSCIKRFFDRLYSPESGFSYHVERGELRELFATVIRNTPRYETDGILELEPSDPEIDASDEYGLASAIVRLLIRDGWIEEYQDRATMVSALRFTHGGKIFAKAFVEEEGRTIHTKQRNVRNTRNALAAFAEGMDPFDLADAHAYSLQVIEDLSDEIADLDDRKQQLLSRAAEGQAIHEFLDYMENHFQPELAVKLVADSVERHRNTIFEIIDGIRDWPEEKRVKVDDKLRPFIPQQMHISERDSPCLILVDRIGQAIDSAYHNKLAELRAALSAFSRAATQLIRQQASMQSGLSEQLITKAIQHLSQVDEPTQEQLLQRLGEQLNLTQAGLIDPAGLRLRKSSERQTVETMVEYTEPSQSERMMVAMAQAEQRAFTISPLAIKDYLLQHIGEGKEIRLSSLKPTDPPAVLNIMHAIEAASTSLSEQGQTLELIPLNETFETPFMTADDFLIRKAS